MKTFYFPPEIWTMIYEYDNTYKKVYNQCMYEMKSYFIHNRMISIMDACFEYYDIYLNRKYAVNNKSCLEYILLKKLDSRSDVYRVPTSIINHTDCWKHYMTKSNKKNYAILKS